jgi:prepilin signal peptidase PulO-like enzyme (type II secretory pathway)
MFDSLPFWPMLFVTGMVVFLGLVLGSFTTCVVYRVPRGLSLWRENNGSYRSFCPQCHAELHTKDLIPVFSWLLQRGRCRYCRAPIPVRYLWIEISVLCLTLALFEVFGLHWPFFLGYCLIPIIAGYGSFLLFKGKL